MYVLIVPRLILITSNVNLCHLRWWRDLGLAKELKFARNQPLKWYTCSMVCLTDPELSDERLELTKPISLVYIIDDIFDVYGTLEELTLFTEAIKKYASIFYVQGLIFSISFPIDQSINPY
jgi:hypothetical protein